MNILRNWFQSALNTASDALHSLIESLDSEDRKLAQRSAPLLHFDCREPFFPSAAGYTVFHKDSQSPSFPRRIILPPSAASVVEYAIWWDWDIQHLYELEHLWVYLDRGKNVIRAEGSWHGRYKVLWDRRYADHLPEEKSRLAVYSEPGKHAFASSPRGLLNRSQLTRLACGLLAGGRGVLVTPLFDPAIRAFRTPLNNALVGRYLRRRAFQPAYNFCNTVDVASLTLVPWPRLAAWIPQRVAWWVNVLAQRHDLLEAVTVEEAMLPEFVNVAC